MTKSQGVPPSPDRRHDLFAIGRAIRHNRAFQLGRVQVDITGKEAAQIGACEVGAFDAGLFIYHLADVTPPPLLVPAAQKGAALLFCLWMVQVAWRGFGGRAVTRHP